MANIHPSNQIHQILEAEEGTGNLVIFKFLLLSPMTITSDTNLKMGIENDAIGNDEDSSALSLKHTKATPTPTNYSKSKTLNNKMTVKQDQQSRRVMIAASEEDDDDDDDVEYLMPVFFAENKVSTQSTTSGRSSSGAPSVSSSRRNSSDALDPPSSRQSSFKLPIDRLYSSLDGFTEKENGTRDRLSAVEPMETVKDDITNSQGSKSVSIKEDRVDRLRCTSGSLDETAHNLKGRGYLASKKDLGMDLDTFAEGCKFLALVARGDLEAVKLWVEDSPDFMQFRDYDRRTALHVAASEGHLHIVEFLVNYLKESNYNMRRTINRSDRWGGSPLDDAHRHRQKEVAQFLRDHGAKTGTFDDHLNEFFVASSQGDVDTIQEIMKFGVNINAGDYDDRTAMHLAASGNHVNVIKVLLDAGADVNALDRWGRRPLDDAKTNDATVSLKVLLDHNAIVGASDKINRKNSVDLSEHIGHKLDHDNLRIEFSELEILDRIGGGAFGEILKCRWRGTLVAAKCIKSAKIYTDWMAKDKQMSVVKEVSRTAKEHAIEDFRLEIDILKQIR